MNREERRAYSRRMRRNRVASICPNCGKSAYFFARKQEDENITLNCECCGEVAREGEEVTYLMQPGDIYLPMSLERFDRVIEEYKEDKGDKEAEEAKANGEKENG